MARSDPWMTQSQDRILQLSLMFKILVVQATNNFSDERAEILINERLLFNLCGS
jgi:hypothetical protein